MDITATEFSARLAAILTHISNAHFVALDFEMSGISMGKSKNKQSGTGNITGLSQKSSPITSPPVNICLECLGTPSPEISTQVSCSCLGSAESLSMSSTPSVSQSPSPSSSLARKQTLQKRYDEVRCAAEKYQILQVGITVAALDSRTGILLPCFLSLLCFWKTSC